MTRPHIVPFSQMTMEGGMAGIVPEPREDTYDMQCFPLYSLLMAAAGNVTVNYLSLDIEGAELQVLQTLPWDKVDIEVMTVETHHAGKVFPGTIQDIRQYLEEQGYVYVYTLGKLLIKKSYKIIVCCLTRTGRRVREERSVPR